MGRSPGSVFSGCGDDSTFLHRQEDVAANVGHIRSDGGTDGRRRRRRWLVYRTFAWWAYLLWFLLILFLSICWVLYPLQAMWKKMLRPISCAMLAGSIVTGGSAMLCLPMNVFLTVYSVLMACLTASMIQTMLNYQRSLHGPAMPPGSSEHPEANSFHKSWRKSALPQVRSMAQPLVMVMPMLYMGMLVGGVPALDGLIVILLLIGAAFVANVLAGVTALLAIRQ